jgi:hypothetical protein
MASDRERELHAEQESSPCECRHGVPEPMYCVKCEWEEMEAQVEAERAEQMGGLTDLDTWENEQVFRDHEGEGDY